MDQNQSDHQSNSGSIDILNNIFKKGSGIRNKKQKSAEEIEKDLKKFATWAKRASSGGWMFGVILFLFFSTLGIVMFAGAPGGVAGGDSSNNPNPSGGSYTPDPNATPGPSFSPGQIPNAKFYCQYADAWQSGGCSIMSNGCGPTSLAMTLASFGESETPVSVAKTNDYGCNRPGGFDQAYNAVYNWVKPKGYAIQTGISNGYSFDISTASKLINNGFLIYSGACITFKSGGNNVKGGHSFLITGVNSDGTLRVFDPTYCSSDNNYSIRTFNPKTDILNGCANKGEVPWGGWGYTYAIKKL